MGDNLLEDTKLNWIAERRLLIERIEEIEEDYFCSDDMA